jgi:hypothetical protein
VERLWRSVKYEDIYIRGYEAVPELHQVVSSGSWRFAIDASPIS